jgi:hypothetical protein
MQNGFERFLEFTASGIVKVIIEIFKAIGARILISAVIFIIGIIWLCSSD